MPDFRYEKTKLTAGRNYPLHLSLFVATLLTTTWAGAIWTGKPPETESVGGFLSALKTGVPFSLSLLAFLTVHEFGHFFATVRHGIRSTLPYYIPLPPLPFLMSIGTLGAVIRMKEPILSRRALFDIGVAGPLTGFAVALGLLAYGFTHLPPAEYIYAIHPEYRVTGGIPSAPTETLYLGKNLLFILLEALIGPKGLPPMHELYHYPFLFAGWLGCFVTALNLLPVGQLDGGHVIYAMFGGEGHRKISKLFLAFITILGAPSFIAAILQLIDPAIVIPAPELLLRWSWPGWIIWAFILRRFLGTKHPHAGSDRPLSKRRMIVGWACIAIFVLTFTPVPFAII
ncbi:peptidase M50 [Chlorobaculum limnaeum]|uniref:Peptidase M50 n=1 Tax=Chlorobaculum limnaeum TaxID=274537 RepID=A0A1D8D1F9_CHLLM|nr:site-2 protease family protein [Chlorobaculum limnaeum]AOS84241.1 peptidase M50 [Chlorobaculum limnaeum]